MITIRDHLLHLAEIDALELAEAYSSITSREWDGRANGKWHEAAEDAGCEVNDYGMRDVYLTALVEECQRLSDQ